MAERAPAGMRDFVQVEQFREIFRKLNDQSLLTNVIVLTGTSGAGKTEIALQIVKRFKEPQRYAEPNTVVDKPPKVLNGIFNCESVQNFFGDISRFAETHGLNVRSLRLGGQLADILLQFFVEVNQAFPNHLKCFIFDDVEKRTDIIKHIDNIICSELHASPHRSKWKLIVTTAYNNGDEWFNGCDNLAQEDFVQISGFDDEEVKKFFDRAGTKSVTPEELKLITLELGNLPVILKVVRYEIKRNRLTDTKHFLKMFFDRMCKVNNSAFSEDRDPSENKALAAFHVSLNRLTEQSNRSREYRELMKLLTLYDEKNLTREILVSCAEVILGYGKDEFSDEDDDEDFEHRSRKASSAAYDLANSFVDEMVKRFLCTEPKISGGTRLISLHKLVRESMMLFRNGDEHLVSSKALLALTRVMPKDGRKHQTHVYYGYMYNHSYALASHVRRLLETTRVSRPCIALMYCDLLMGMGYCQLARGSKTPSAIEHLDEAFTTYSKLMTDKGYAELIDSHGDAAEFDMLRAKALCEAVPKSSIYENMFYREELVKNLTRYHRMTVKDLSIIVGRPIDKDEDWICNGHLTSAKFKELRREGGKILNTESIARIYPVELLAELYSLYSKAHTFHADDALTEKCFDCAQAALNVYSEITRIHEVRLLAEIITRRELLKIKFELDELDPRCPPLKDIETEWKNLMNIHDVAYEYGLMRTDLSRDKYHKFLCKEAVADCKGRLYVVERDAVVRQQLLEDGRYLFREVVERSITENLNPLTTSKAYRNFAVFLFRCGQQRDAIRAIVDAMSYLNEYLHSKDPSFEFPEQQDRCTKFNPLLTLLRNYYQQYDHRLGPILSDNQSDLMKVSYLVRFVRSWKFLEKEVTAAPGRYDVIEELLKSSDIDPSDEKYDSIKAKGVVQATY